MLRLRRRAVFLFYIVLQYSASSQLANLSGKLACRITIGRHYGLRISSKELSWPITFLVKLCPHVVSCKASLTMDVLHLEPDSSRTNLISERMPKPVAPL